MSGGRRFASSESGDSSSPFYSSRLAPTTFRSLVWQGSVPVRVELDESELGGNSDRLTDCYYVNFVSKDHSHAGPWLNGDDA